MKEKISRLGIFVFFDPQGIVDDYVVVLLKALRENLSRLVVVSNTKLDATARTTLEQNADAVFERENQGFDAAGFKAGMVTYCGWDEVQRYDEVVLINDTFFGPIHSFADMFAEMAEKDVDFWGMSAHYAAEDGWHRVKYGYIPSHIQTFFVAFRKKMVCTDVFRSYWDRYDDSMNDFVSVVTQHETIMTKHFEDLGFKWAIYSDTGKYNAENRYENFNLYHHHSHRMMKEMKFPVLKKKVLGLNFPDYLNMCDLEEPADAMRYIHNESEYDTKLIWDNVLRLYNISDLYHTLHLNCILPSIPVEGNHATRTAIVFHVANPFFVDRFCVHAANMAPFFDVYMIPATEEIRQAVQSTLPNEHPITLIDAVVEYEEMLNFLLCCKELMEQYTYLGFVHDVVSTEHEPATVSESSVNNYLQNIANDETYVQQVIHCFEQNPRMGVLGTPFPIHRRGFGTYGNEWGNWFDSVCDLAKELGLSCNLSDEKNPFMITGAFWCRTDALRGIWKKDWDRQQLKNSSPEERIELNETLKRILPFVAQSKRYYSGIVMHINYASMRLTDQQYMLDQIVHASNPDHGYPDYSFSEYLAIKQFNLKRMIKIVLKNYAPVWFSNFVYWIYRVCKKIMWKLRI